MAVKIRLARRGAKKAPYYRIVVADGRAARDGRFIEVIGRYNPRTEPSTVELDLDKVDAWIAKGAQPTEAVVKLVAIARGEKTAPAVEPKVSKKAAAKAAEQAAAAEAPAKATDEDVAEEAAADEDVAEEAATDEDVAVEEAPAEETSEQEEVSPDDEPAAEEPSAEDVGEEAAAEPASDE